MKRILLFGAGKSATCLIDYLIAQSSVNDWFITIADANPEVVQSKAGNTANMKAVALDVANENERKLLVQHADLVISLLPPSLHFLIALDCIDLNKNLLTASYVDQATSKLQTQVKAKGLLFLFEMGLDPGIDHMSAMQIIDRIKKEEGKIISFKSHTGGLVAPESDDNPWRYKVSWNPRNIVRAGAAGAVYKENNEIITIHYKDLFEDCHEIEIYNAGKLSYYPNRDSLAYIHLYSLEEAVTFVRTTLRYPVFCRNWKYIVSAGLTDDEKIIETNRLTYKQWSAPIISFINEENKPLFNYLGLFDETHVPASAKTAADILQYLLETKLIMRPHDKDMIVMQHELEYQVGDQKSKIKSSLIVKGEDNLRTAMAKTVGLPLGIAAKLILQDRINLTGLQIPTMPQIYEPVLEELAAYNIIFREES